MKNFSRAAAFAFRTRPFPLKRALLLSCAAGAGLIPAEAALAQSACIECTPTVPAGAFQGTPTTTSGSVTYTRNTNPVVGSETIIVQSQSAIINWTPYNPNDNPIIFLPQGYTATFENGLNNGDFAVLNRIAATNPVRFDGTVISRLRDIAAGTSRPGGTVLFSSPGGIIIGATAVFDVGNLVLTTLNVDADPNGNFMGPNGSFRFSGGANNPNAAVITETGAQINALSEGSFVAMVAPRVEHGGSTRVNGSVAYIAGEDVQMQVNQGLFDIIVSTGTDNATPIIHTGSTGGPASGGGGDHHAIYMVAVPKNQAITMLLSGDVGFDAATAATVENGEIVLSAGYGVFGGELPEQGRPAGAPAADLQIDGGTWSSRVTGLATSDARVTATARDISFLSDVDLGGVETASMSAQNGFDISVDGDVSLLSRGTTDADGNVTGGTAFISTGLSSTIDITGSAAVRATPIQDNGNATGGTARIAAIGGIIRIGGDAIVEALANTFDPSGTGGTATGGFAEIFARNAGQPGTTGRIEIGGNALVSSYAFGRDGGFAGTGGTSRINAGIAGTIDIAGSAELNAQGMGGNNLAGDGGTGTGGSATIFAAAPFKEFCACLPDPGGTVNIGGHTVLNAGGEGGAGTGTGGAGIGGSALIEQRGGSIELADLVALGADGAGGTGATGGNGTGGSAGVLVYGGQLTFPGTLFASARGFGSQAVSGLGGRGGDGTGGVAFIQSMVDANGFGTIVGGDVFLDVSGSGGRGGDGDGSTVAPGAGGTGTGGAFTGQTGSGGAFALAQVGSSLTLASATLSSFGVGGAGGDGVGTQAGGAGGAGVGGTTQAGTFIGDADPAATTGSASLGEVTLNSSALGGVGGAGEGGQGAGGSAEGGSAFLIAQVRPVAATSATLAANALGGGGQSEGDAIGGLALARADGAALNVTGDLVLDASAIGGGGATAGEGGGDGFAGEAVFEITSGSATLGQLSMTALGTATGSPVAIDLDQASLDVAGDARLESSGDIAIEIAQSTVNIGGELALIALGSLEPEIDDETSDVTVGSLLGRIGGDVALGSIEAFGTIDIVAGGMIDVGTLAGGGIILRAGGSLTADTLLSTESIVASSETSFVDIGTAIAGASPPPETAEPEGEATAAEAGSGGFIRIDAATDASIDSGSATGGIGILARSGSIDAGPLEAGRSVVALAGESIVLQSVVAGTGADDYVYLASSEMISTFGESFEAALLGGIAPLPTAGPITLEGAVTAGNLVAGTQGNFTAEETIDAGRLLDVRAGDFADFQARATATTIRVRSADIGFGSGDVGGLGDSSTESIILTVAPNVEAIFIGGDPGDSGYRLGDREIGQLKAANITVEAFSSEEGAPPTINVGTATVNGSAAGESANITSEEGSFRISTSGNVRVTGDFGISAAGAGNQLIVDAGDLIQVVTPAGSLRVRDSSGNPAGSLSLQARNIWVTGQAIADQLAADVDFSGRDEALGDNDGEDRPRGAIEAGAVTLTVRDSLFVQNSGTEADPAGITVGEGGLIVRSVSPEGSTQVLAFGRRLDADGGFTTGSDFFQEATFETSSESGTSGFTDDSRFNNCVINTGTCPVVVDPVDDPPPVGPTTSSSSIEGPLGEDGGAGEDGGEEGGGGGVGQMSTQLVDTSALEDEPIFEEPVTSGGDVNLWWDDDEDDDDEEDEDGDGNGDEEEGGNGND